jgi:hypothetical protein
MASKIRKTACYKKGLPFAGQAFFNAYSFNVSFR